MSRRRKTTRPISVEHSRRDSASLKTKAKKTRSSSERGPEVSAEERHRLAECCAFFMAEHYREAEPGKIRQCDVEAAEAQIDAVLKKSGK